MTKGNAHPGTSQRPHQPGRPARVPVGSRSSENMKQDFVFLDNNPSCSGDSGTQCSCVVPIFALVLSCDNVFECAT